MKRGLIILFLLAFVFSTLSALAYNGYYNEFDNFNFGDLSISNLANNEWVNAALLFLLIFAACWFVLQNVFSRSAGAAFVVSFVLGIAGSFGFISYFGNIIPMVGWWVVALFLIIIFIVLWKQLRGKGTTFFIVLLAIALLWLFWARSQLCPYLLPHIICVVLDSAAIVIIILAFFKLIIWIFKLIQHQTKPEWKWPKSKDKKEKIEKNKKEEFRRRQRTAGELQVKWDHYRNLFEQEWNKYQKRAKRQGLRKGMPPKNSPEGHKRMWCLKAMKSVERMARKRGIALRTKKLW